MKKTIVIISIVIIVAIMVFSFFYFFSNKSVAVYPIPLNSADQIIVVSPIKDSKISSPLTIAGRARGGWFFEGTFPVLLLDQNNNTVAEGHVSTQGDWTKDELIKFVGNLQFEQTLSGQKGTLVFKKDNPSGLVQNDGKFEIPIIFK